MSELNRVVFSSNSDEWETPHNLFEELHKEFNFEADICADEKNKKLDFYFSKESVYGAGALGFDWALSKLKTVFMNPPYSEVKDWVKKAYDESRNGVKIVALLPARTDTKWFHEFVYGYKNVEIRFIAGRLKFSGAKHNAPFPSMIVVFNPIKKRLKKSTVIENVLEVSHAI